jgi:putative phosphoribosyl transferase
MRFLDREQAGQSLAIALNAFISPITVVLGLPRGGIIAARPIADYLHAPLDALIVRKLGAPGNPEYAIGALAEIGAPQWNQDALRYLAILPPYLDAELARARDEIRRRQSVYRGGRQLAGLTGRRVILVDDGIATGYTMLVAAQAVRSDGAAEIVVATPIASPQSLLLLERAADSIVALQTPSPFYSVGEFYSDFNQVTDSEVLAALVPRGRDVGDKPASGG